CAVHPRDLHSFPTRRSSDLQAKISHTFPFASALGLGACLLHIGDVIHRRFSCCGGITVTDRVEDGTVLGEQGLACTRQVVNACKIGRASCRERGAVCGGGGR